MGRREEPWTIRGASDGSNRQCVSGVHVHALRPAAASRLCLSSLTPCYETNVSELTSLR